eukprot:TRINITY_DN3199_c0_g1_i1.p1 TRINITY_DN3199_c0_g1~~TRINITY_DN3199_c0_g1_i1.p1  ORF type:complete len:194 (+),score=25.23 TRINITY_DN3199_c0_g1_i1:25-606(+)
MEHNNKLTKESLLDGETVTVVRKFLSNQECKEMITRAEANGFVESSPSGGGHGRTGREDARNNSYTIVVDPSMAFMLWKKVQNTIPRDLTFISDSPYFGSAGGAEWSPVGVVERLRFYKYEVGESYPEHMDGAYKRMVTNSNGETFHQQTFLTLLIYLNDGFDGGNTVFFPDHQHCRFLRDVENKIPRRNRPF